MSAACYLRSENMVDPIWPISILSHPFPITQQIQQIILDCLTNLYLTQHEKTFTGTEHIHYTTTLLLGRILRSSQNSTIILCIKIKDLNNRYISYEKQLNVQQAVVCIGKLRYHFSSTVFQYPEIKWLHASCLSRCVKT